MTEVPITNVIGPILRTKKKRMSRKGVSNENSNKNEDEDSVEDDELKKCDTSDPSEEDSCDGFSPRTPISVLEGNDSCCYEEVAAEENTNQDSTVQNDEQIPENVENSQEDVNENDKENVDIKYDCKKSRNVLTILDAWNTLRVVKGGVNLFYGPSLHLHCSGHVEKMKSTCDEFTHFFKKNFSVDSMSETVLSSIRKGSLKRCRKSDLKPKDGDAKLPAKKTERVIDLCSDDDNDLDNRQNKDEEVRKSSKGIVKRLDQHGNYVAREEVVLEDEIPPKKARMEEDGNEKTPVNNEDVQRVTLSIERQNYLKRKLYDAKTQENDGNLQDKKVRIVSLQTIECGTNTARENDEHLVTPMTSINCNELCLPSTSNCVVDKNNEFKRLDQIGNYVSKSSGQEVVPESQSLSKRASMERNEKPLIDNKDVEGCALSVEPRNVKILENDSNLQDGSKKVQIDGLETTECGTNTAGENDQNLVTPMTSINCNELCLPGTSSETSSDTNKNSSNNCELHQKESLISTGDDLKQEVTKNSSDECSKAGTIRTTVGNVVDRTRQYCHRASPKHAPIFRKTRVNKVNAKRESLLTIIARLHQKNGNVAEIDSNEFQSPITTSDAGQPKIAVLCKEVDDGNHKNKKDSNMARPEDNDNLNSQSTAIGDGIREQTNVIAVFQKEDQNTMLEPIIKQPSIDKETNSLNLGPRELVHNETNDSVAIKSAIANENYQNRTICSNSQVFQSEPRVHNTNLYDGVQNGSVDNPTNDLVRSNLTDPQIPNCNSEKEFWSALQLQSKLAMHNTQVTNGAIKHSIDNLLGIPPKTVDVPRRSDQDFAPTIQNFDRAINASVVTQRVDPEEARPIVTVDVPGSDPQTEPFIQNFNGEINRNMVTQKLDPVEAISKVTLDVPRRSGQVLAQTEPAIQNFNGEINRSVVTQRIDPLEARPIVTVDVPTSSGQVFAQIEPTVQNSNGEINRSVVTQKLNPIEVRPIVTLDVPKRSDQVFAQIEPSTQNFNGAINRSVVSQRINPLEANPVVTLDVPRRSDQVFAQIEPSKQKFNGAVNRSVITQKIDPLEARTIVTVDVPTSSGQAFARIEPTVQNSNEAINRSIVNQKNYPVEARLIVTDDVPRRSDQVFAQIESSNQKFIGAINRSVVTQRIDPLEARPIVTVDVPTSSGQAFARIEPTVQNSNEAINRSIVNQKKYPVEARLIVTDDVPRRSDQVFAQIESSNQNFIGAINRSVVTQRIDPLEARPILTVDVPRSSDQVFAQIEPKIQNFNGAINRSVVTQRINRVEARPIITVDVPRSSGQGCARTEPKSQNFNRAINRSVVTQRIDPVEARPKVTLDVPKKSSKVFRRIAPKIQNFNGVANRSVVTQRIDPVEARPIVTVDVPRNGQGFTPIAPKIQNFNGAINGSVVTQRIDSVETRPIVDLNCNIYSQPMPAFLNYNVPGLLHQSTTQFFRADNNPIPGRIPTITTSPLETLKKGSVTKQGANLVTGTLNDNERIHSQERIPKINKTASPLKTLKKGSATNQAANLAGTSKMNEGNFLQPMKSHTTNKGIDELELFKLGGDKGASLVEAGTSKTSGGNFSQPMKSRTISKGIDGLELVKLCKSRKNISEIISEASPITEQRNRACVSENVQSFAEKDRPACQRINRPRLSESELVKLCMSEKNISEIISESSPIKEHRNRPCADLQSFSEKKRSTCELINRKVVSQLELLKSQNNISEIISEASPIKEHQNKTCVSPDLQSLAEEERSVYELINSKGLNELELLKPCKSRKNISEVICESRSIKEPPNKICVSPDLQSLAEEERSVYELINRKGLKELELLKLCKPRKNISEVISEASPIEEHKNGTCESTDLQSFVDSKERSACKLVKRERVIEGTTLDLPYTACLKIGDVSINRSCSVVEKNNEFKRLDGNYASKSTREEVVPEDEIPAKRARMEEDEIEKTLLDNEKVQRRPLSIDQQNVNILENNINLQVKTIRIDNLEIIKCGTETAPENDQNLVKQKTLINCNEFCLPITCNRVIDKNNNFARITFEPPHRACLKVTVVSSYRSCSVVDIKNKFEKLVQDGNYESKSSIEEIVSEDQSLALKVTVVSSYRSCSVVDMKNKFEKLVQDGNYESNSEVVSEDQSPGFDKRARMDEDEKTLADNEDVQRLALSVEQQNVENDSILQDSSEKVQIDSLKITECETNTAVENDQILVTPMSSIDCNELCIPGTSKHVETPHRAGLIVADVSSNQSCSVVDKKNEFERLDQDGNYVSKSSTEEVILEDKIPDKRARIREDANQKTLVDNEDVKQQNVNIPENNSILQNGSEKVQIDSPKTAECGTNTAIENDQNLVTPMILINCNELCLPSTSNHAVEKNNEFENGETRSINDGVNDVTLIKSGLDVGCQTMPIFTMEDLDCNYLELVETESSQVSDIEVNCQYGLPILYIQENEEIGFVQVEVGEEGGGEKDIEGEEKNGERQIQDEEEIEESQDEHLEEDAIYEFAEEEVEGDEEQQIEEEEMVEKSRDEEDHVNQNKQAKKVDGGMNQKIDVRKNVDDREEQIQDYLRQITKLYELIESIKSQNPAESGKQEADAIGNPEDFENEDTQSDDDFEKEKEEAVNAANEENEDVDTNEQILDIATGSGEKSNKETKEKETVTKKKQMRRNPSTSKRIKTLKKGKSEKRTTESFSHYEEILEKCEKELPKIWKGKSKRKEIKRRRSNTGLQEVIDVVQDKLELNSKCNELAYVFMAANMNLITKMLLKRAGNIASDVKEISAKDIEMSIEFDPDLKKLVPGLIYKCSEIV